METKEETAMCFFGLGVVPLASAIGYVVPLFPMAMLGCTMLHPQTVVVSPNGCVLKWVASQKGCAPKGNIALMSVVCLGSFSQLGKVDGPGVKYIT